MADKTDELIDELRLQRYENFRGTHGIQEGEFVGDPKAEAVEELLDHLNYLDEVEKRGEEIDLVRGLVRAATAICLRRWGYKP